MSFTGISPNEALRNLILSWRLLLRRETDSQEQVQEQGEPIIIIHIDGFSDCSKRWSFGSHSTHQNVVLGISQPQTGGGRGFCGSKEINSHLPEAMFPGRGILSAVGKKEAECYRETGGRKVWKWSGGA